MNLPEVGDFEPDADGEIPEILPESRQVSHVGGRREFAVTLEGDHLQAAYEQTRIFRTPFVGVLVRTKCSQFLS